MILFKNVSKLFELNSLALSNVSFSVGYGEFVFFTGHSGAGKSTIMRLIMKIDEATKGEICVGGHQLAKLAGYQIPYYRRNIGMLSQEHHLLTHLSVFDNVALPLIVAGYSLQDCNRRVFAALNQVGLTNRINQATHTLSAGQKQRVGLARAIVNKPSLILADEPTGNLDPELSYETMQLLLKFTQYGTTVLVATHDLALVKHMKNRVLMLESGHLVHDGVL